MTVVDLTTTPTPPPADLLDGLPRRIGLTLAELQHAARLANNAPLPFATSRPPRPGGGSVGAGRSDRLGDRLDDRLGAAGGDAESAYDGAVRALPDPEDSLTRRGLLTAGELDAGLAGALGLLAAPRLAVDLDLAVGRDRLRSWHRQLGDAVAALSTADGLVFELAWCHTSQWADELARVATVPEVGADGAGDRLGVLNGLRVPFELADTAAEAVAAGRADLLPVLWEQLGPITDDAGGPLASADAQTALGALTGPCRGRLRVLATDVHRAGGLPVAAVSWLLLRDGWHALEPTPAAGSGSLVVRAVEPSDLALTLAPALAAVTS